MQVIACLAQEAVDLFQLLLLLTSVAKKKLQKQRDFPAGWKLGEIFVKATDVWFEK